MDLIARCITSSLFVSHSIRKDTNIHFLLQGGIEKNELPRILSLSGENIRYLNPDERSTASLIRNALLQFSLGKKGTPGISVRLGDIGNLLSSLTDHEIYLLSEDGTDIRSCNFELNKNIAFVLSDNYDLEKEEFSDIMKFAKGKISIGPVSILTSQCITIVNNELDRLWNRLTF
jgi:tRNA (pseudouridine54-N1)-methyltransferase